MLDIFISLFYRRSQLSSELNAYVETGDNFNSTLIQWKLFVIMSSYCNQTLLLPQCAARSVGPANQAFIQLIQTLLIAHCSLSEPDLWPDDHGPIAAERGKEHLISHR